MNLDTIPSDFDWEFYINYYPDLQKAGLKTKEDAIAHYLNSGFSEKRIYKNYNNKLFETIINETLSEFSFDKLRKERKIFQTPTKLAFTLTTFDRLAQAKILGDSILETNSEFDFVIFLIGNKPKDFIFPYKIISINEIEKINEIDLDEKYSLDYFCFSLKPYCFYHLTKNTNYEKFVYFDCDILVFKKMSELDEMFEKFDLILTPHILEPSNLNDFDIERSLLKGGLFNMGFLGLKKTSNSLDFIDWWSERLKKFCKIDSCECLFGDQKWVDLAIILFDKIGIIKNQGYNVAFWNLFQRKVSKNNNKFVVNEKDDLVFLHFSGYEFNGLLSKHWNLNLETDHVLLEIFSNYTKLVSEHEHLFIK